MYMFTLQMKGRWESNINVWFRFMYSEKWNCMASLFPEQNLLMFCLPISKLCTYLWAIYIFPGSVSLFCCSQISRQILGICTVNSSQIHECRNWEWGHAVSFLGIHQSDFRYSAVQYSSILVLPTCIPVTLEHSPLRYRIQIYPDKKGNEIFLMY